LVIEISGINGNAQNILFLFERGESADNLGLLIGHQESSLGLEENLGLVLLGYFPLILERDTSLVFNGELLFAGDTRVCRRIEELCLIGNCKMRLVAVTN